MKFVIPFLPILFGFLLDALLGDPYSMPHPIRWIGKLIAGLSGSARAGRTKLTGFLIAFCVLGLTGMTSAALVCVSSEFSTIARIIVESVLCYYMLAARCLRNESEKVRKAAADGDIEGARQYRAAVEVWMREKGYGELEIPARYRNSLEGGE